MRVSCPICGAPSEGQFCGKCGSFIRSGRTDSYDSQPQSNAAQPLYEDLAAKIIDHTWLVVTYAVSCVVLLYVLRLWADATVLFVAAELPTLILTTAVLRNNERLLFRVPFTWVTTALLVWAYYHSSRDGGSIPNELVAVSTTVVVVYWLVRGIRGSVVEYLYDLDELHESTATLANLISAWGATLQVATISLLLIQPILIPVLKSTTVGWPVLMGLNAIRWTSPWSWFPMGILLFGLVLQAALLFKTDPYVPKNFADVLSGEAPWLLTAIIAVLRLPTWLCVVMAGFISHFVRLLWESLGRFLDWWVGRLILILLGLVLPTMLLMIAHWAVLAAMSYITIYLSPNGNTLGNTVVTMVVVHILALVGMCLFITVPVPLTLEIVPTPIRNIPKMVEAFLENDGKPAANSVGRTFSLYGSLVLAVPLAASLPGGSSLGAFSFTYIFIIVSALAIYLFRR